jgi:hypothetical protein
LPFPTSEHLDRLLARHERSSLRMLPQNRGSRGPKKSQTEKGQVAYSLLESKSHEPGVRLPDLSGSTTGAWETITRHYFG